MSREHANLHVRVPPELLDWLKEEAAKNDRSVNGEVMQMLKLVKEIRSAPKVEPFDAAVYLAKKLREAGE